MKSFKLTPARTKALKIVKWFIPKEAKTTFRLPMYEWKEGDKKLYKKIEEAKDGIDAIEAFFMISETGKVPEKVNNTKKLSHLLSGQRWMAAHEKMYRNDIRQGLLFRTDFEDEPDYIQEFVNRIFDRNLEAWSNALDPLYRKLLKEYLK